MTVADFAPMLGMLIGLGVGIDYALFIVTRHRAGLKRGLTVAEAGPGRRRHHRPRRGLRRRHGLHRAARHARSCGSSFLNGVAIAAALTVVLTVAASVTLLPALLGLHRHAGARAGASAGAWPSTGPQPEAAHRARRPLVGLRRTAPQAARRRSPLAVMAVLALPTFSLRLGTSDQGNDPAPTTTRQAYDLLADGFGPGVNGPLTLVAHLDGADDRLALDNLAATLRTTPGVASVSPVTYNPAGDTAYLTVVPEPAPQSARTSDLVDRLRNEVLPARRARHRPRRLRRRRHRRATTTSRPSSSASCPSSSAWSSASAASCCCSPSARLAIPLKAAAMNVAAVAAAFGVVTAVFQWGWGSELARPRRGRARSSPSCR